VHDAPQRKKPQRLSEHDPPPDRRTRGRTPWLVIVMVVLLAMAFVALHLTGVVGPGSH
jgi:hypothetical protein